MKTKFTFLIAFALLIQVANAQTFGIKGGVNFANMSFSSNAEMSPNSITGYHIGPIVDFGLSGNLFLNTGLLFSIKGYTDTSDLEGETIKETLTFNTLEIPLYLAFKFPMGDNMKLFVQAGPYFSYALSAKDKWEAGDEEGSETINFDEWGINRWDYGAAVGGGVEFGRIVASLNYQLGLSDLSDESGDSEEEAMTAKSKIFQISIAYMFGK